VALAKLPSDVQLRRPGLLRRSTLRYHAKSVLTLLLRGAGHHVVKAGIDVELDRYDNLKAYPQRHQVGYGGCLRAGQLKHDGQITLNVGVRYDAQFLDEPRQAGNPIADPNQRYTAGGADSVPIDPNKGRRGSAINSDVATVCDPDLLLYVPARGPPSNN
jgi:hypothetical protein